MLGHQLRTLSDGPLEIVFLGRQFRTGIAIIFVGDNGLDDGLVDPHHLPQTALHQAIDIAHHKFVAVLNHGVLDMAQHILARLLAPFLARFGHATRRQHTQLDARLDNQDGGTGFRRTHRFGLADSRRGTGRHHQTRSRNKQTFHFSPAAHDANQSSPQVIIPRYTCPILAAIQKTAGYEACRLDIHKYCGAYSWPRTSLP